MALAKSKILMFLVVVFILPSAVPDSGAVSRERWKIAVLLWHESPNDLAALRGLKRGLAAMNMAQDLVVLNAHADEPKAKDLLRRSIGEGAQLIVALGTRSAKIAAATTTTTPIVFTAVTNPVLSGITPSWSGSGTNVAGNSNWLDRREMISSFKLALPTLKKLGVLRSPDNSVSRAEIAEARAALGSSPELELIEIEVKEPAKVGEVLEKNLERLDAVWVPIDFPLYQEKPLAQIVKVARARRIPIFSSTVRCAGAGALVVLTVDFELLGLKASALIRDILVRGKVPGKMKVGRMKSSRLFVDLEAARHINLKLPFELILGAHRLFGAEPKK